VGGKGWGRGKNARDLRAGLFVNIKMGVVYSKKGNAEVEKGPKRGKSLSRHTKEEQWWKMRAVGEPSLWGGWARDEESNWANSDVRYEKNLIFA